MNALRTLNQSIEVVVIGNVCLDIVCSFIEEVPRYDSIEFSAGSIQPGGCASNVAIGLASLGHQTALVACVGVDEGGAVLETAWSAAGVNTKSVRRITDVQTALTVCLVDPDSVPRFIYAPGANAVLAPPMFTPELYRESGARAIHVAGYFTTPGTLAPEFVEKLAETQALGMLTSLDVALSPRMSDPSILWNAMPFLDIFMCNDTEAERLTGYSDPLKAAPIFRDRGAGAVVVKLGRKGCWLNTDNVEKHVAPFPINAVDTTGAGDAFAAGLLHGLLNGLEIEAACEEGARQGARACSQLGAAAHWKTKK